jgi:DNA-binding CsgD family transcriptional regulator
MSTSFEILRVTRLVPSTSAEEKVRPALTPRQRDCVILVARGSTDEQIAAMLGISKLTAHKHVEAAKRRYGVTTRVRLVVDALFANELSFAAIFATE